MLNIWIKYTIEYYPNHNIPLISIFTSSPQSKNVDGSKTLYYSHNNCLAFIRNVKVVFGLCLPNNDRIDFFVTLSDVLKRFLTKLLKIRDDFHNSLLIKIMQQ